jgi:TolB-like protein/class 3 adenylate cyclase
MERKLAVILAADVVGYTTLMEADESGTHERLKARRKELFEPEIARHHGRVFKIMGDGLLAEFTSVVDAVECAVALQRGLAERNSEITSAQRIEVRIGINLGELIVEGNDRYGEGVNIATRIEQLADAGGICVSGKVAKEVEKKLAFGFEPMGLHKVKNILEPISVFRIRLDAKPGRRRSLMPSRRAWLWTAAMTAILLILAGTWFGTRLVAPETVAMQNPAVMDERPSLVVLPFSNLSSDKEQDYLADGITEDLTTALARIPGLFVISRNSAFTYKGKSVSSAQVAKELGIRYILEGSIRRAGDDMRINAQLIDANSSGHLWAERYDGAWNDVFTLQDQVIASVAAALKVRLVAGPKMAQSPGGTDNPAAYELYLRAYDLSYATSPGEAAGLLRQAVALDPDFGQAWAELAAVYWTAAGVEEAQEAIGTSSYQETVAKLKELMKAAERRPSSNYYQLASDLLIWQRNSDEAVLAGERAIPLDPSNYWAYEQMSRVLVFNGRAADAKTYFDASWRVDPQPRPYRNVVEGLIAFSQGRFEDAITALQKADPRDFHIDRKDERLFLLAAAHAHLGHTEAAASASAELEASGKDGIRERTGLWARNMLPFKQSSDTERLLTGLAKAGVPELPFGYETKNQLTGEEIRTLVFGNELRGRQIDSGEVYVRSVATDGPSKLTIGSRSTTGTSVLEQGLLCTTWDDDIVKTCVAILRNPGGVYEKQNEYVVVAPLGRFEFSVMK